MKEKGNKFPRDIMEQAEVIRDGWQELISKLNVPNMSIDTFNKKIIEAKAKIEATERLRAERAQMVQVRNIGLRELWGFTKKVRNAAKATFGDNSPEILKFGGKLSHERKRRKKSID